LYDEQAGLRLASGRAISDANFSMSCEHKKHLFVHLMIVKRKGSFVFWYGGYVL
jgi:hypothetical protein